MILSIIIPGYERYRNIYNLLVKINSQMQENVEVILVDDGSPVEYNYKYDWLKIIRLNENSGGASIPRNVGLDNATGDYISFIDSDDMISDDYIEKILDKINNEDFDYCYISWKSSDKTVIIDNEPPFWNCCVWDCIYKKELIGNIRFDKKLKMAEDADFNNKVRKGKKANITDILYYYNGETENSLTKQGELYNDKFKEE